MYIIIGLLTGLVTLIYKILIGSVPSYMILFGGLGLIVLFLIVSFTLRLWNRMQEINEEMKHVD